MGVLVLPVTVHGNQDLESPERLRALAQLHRVLQDLRQGNLPAIQSDTPEKRALTKKELDAIQKTEFTEREKAFVYLALYTGCRRGEIIALQRKDIDFKKKTIAIVQAAELVKNQTKIKDPKSKAGFRTLPIQDPLYPVLQAYCKDLDPGDHLFTTSAGAVMSKTSFTKMWEQIYIKINDTMGGKNQQIFEK